MVALLDCIGLPEELMNDNLVKFIEVSGKISEVKAVTFKSLA